MNSDIFLEEEILNLYFIIFNFLLNTAVDKLDLNSKFVDFGLNFLDLLNQKFNNLKDFF